MAGTNMTQTADYATGKRRRQTPVNPRKPYPMRTMHEKWIAYNRRLGRLRAERSDWMTYWYDLGLHTMPQLPRIFRSDRNDANKYKFDSLLDNCATRSVQTLSAGLMAGMTSQARPWFKLRTKRRELNDSLDVRRYFDEVEILMRSVFNESNVYDRLPQIYEELGIFGTSATLLLSDFDTVIRMYPLNVGEYCLAQDWQGRIVTVYREFERTVGEVVKEFGYENCSAYVQDQYDNRELDNWVRLLHVVEPRSDQDRDLASPSRENMPWRSVYMEQSDQSRWILRESGFMKMRVLAPRWQVNGNDIYGRSPAMTALGDIMQLQHEQMRKAQAIDYQTLPPLQVPSSMKDRGLDEQLPGGRSYYDPATIITNDQVGPQGGIRTAFEVQLEIQPLLLDIEDIRLRIKKAFFEDLFLMLATRGTDGTMTATEVIERQEEKLLMIGPVLQKLSTELLEPLIEITYEQMGMAGILPPLPEELQGEDYEIEFVSILAQAQHQVGIAGIQQYMGDLLVVAERHPEVMDNVNIDEWARLLAEMRGVPGQMLVDKADVDMLREARAQAQAAQEQVAMAQQQASTVKDLSQAPVDQNSALDQVMSELGGAAA